MNKKLVFIFIGLFIVLQKPFCQNWEAFSTGVSEAVKGILVDSANNLLYIGGPFRYVNGQEMKGITVWDGQSFDSLSYGADNCGNFNCNSIIPQEIFQGDLYCSTGGVTSINGVFFNGICRWDGQEWNTVGNGLTYNDQGAGGGQMLVYNDELYVTGGFNKAGTVDAIGLAKWDGEQWYSLDDQQSIDSVSFLQAWSIALYNDEIYVGGNMWVSIDGVMNADIIKYDGTRFRPVANASFKGALGSINAIEVYKDELYIGGLIYTSQGNPGSGILKLEGDEWVDVGRSFDNDLFKVQDMFVHDDKLYVLGLFYSVGGGLPASNIATWDGEQWCGLGGYTDGIISSGTVFQDQIYIGGGFDTIDSNEMESLARWFGEVSPDTCGAIVSTTSEIIIEEDARIIIYPNPSTGNLKIELDNPMASNFSFDLRIFNSLGQVVHQGDMTLQREEIDVSFLSAGIYWINLIDKQNEYSIIESFVIQR